jgi:hypothetical protein
MNDNRYPHDPVVIRSRLNASMSIRVMKTLRKREENLHESKSKKSIITRNVEFDRFVRDRTKFDESRVALGVVATCNNIKKIRNMPHNPILTITIYVEYYTSSF